MTWCLSDRFDPAAVRIADQHYPRQKPGTNQFVRPGTCLVLLQDGALWVTSWPKFAIHAWSGAWDNSTFWKADGGELASDMIREAVACTRWKWPEVPALGMITMIDPDAVRHKRDPGRCYLKAGFHHAGWTKVRKRRVLQLDPSDMPEALEPLGAQQRFEVPV